MKVKVKLSQRAKIEIFNGKRALALILLKLRLSFLQNFVQGGPKKSL